PDADASRGSPSSVTAVVDANTRIDLRPIAHLPHVAKRQSDRSIPGADGRSRTELDRPYDPPDGIPDGNGTFCDVTAQPARRHFAAKREVMPVTRNDRDPF